MKKLVSLLGLCWIVCGSYAAAGVVVTAVGTNNHFPSPGGTGQIEGQQAGTATLVKEFTAIGDIPIILQLTPSVGTDVIHIDERVTNNTGVDWTDFHFIMETIDSGPMTVQFQNVTNPTGEWTTISPALNRLDLFGLVAAGDIFSISFDLQIVAQPEAFNLFGIHEIPTVPEPASVAMLALGALGLVGGAVRRRRGSLN